MKKKGFTLVELLVVIAIIAMLLAILMPALNRVKQLAYRLVCGSNLGGLGKAMVTYSNDYEEQYPILLGTGAVASTWDYKLQGLTWDQTMTNFDPSRIQRTSITSSLYLLVKYSEVSPATFVCKATDQKKFELVTDPASSTRQNYSSSGIRDIAEAWDFGGGPGGTTPPSPGGNGPWDFCSYSYQMPYKVSTTTMPPSPSYPITSSSSSGMAVMADASPWYVRGQVQTAKTGNTLTSGPYVLVDTDWVNGNLKKDRSRWANSTNHTNEGQNVLFTDSHTAFEATPNIGLEQDNIYTAWTANAVAGASTSPADKQGGVAPTGFTNPKTDISQAADDSFLAN